MVNIQDGLTCLFWDDMWLNRVPKIQFPELYSFARNANISLRAASEAQDPSELFHIPISEIALQQLLALAQDISSLPETDDKDIWSYIWGSPFSSSSKAYKHLTRHRLVHAAFNWLWKSACQNKHKVYFWLLLNDRLSTRELLKRKNMVLPSFTCVCCTLSVEELVCHLFINCPFAQLCWSSIGLVVGQDDAFTTLENLKIQLGVPFSMDIIITMCWCIWMQRNDLIFRGIQPTQDQCHRHFGKEFSLVILRAKVGLKQFMSSWLEAHL